MSQRGVAKRDGFGGEAEKAGMLRGLTTVNFWTDDMEAAKEWYTAFLGIEPYFVRPVEGPPAYVEFRLGDYQHELGIVDSSYAPEGAASDPGGGFVYWHVDDVAATLEKLLAMGAKEHLPITPREEGFVTAAVVDPFGNVLGIMRNPHYLEILGSRGVRGIVRLHADDGGTGGPPVVFLHSAAGNASQWSWQLEHLRPERRAVALDWRGHGRSGFPDDGDFSIPALAEDVEHTLNRLGIREFVLIGHSAGGIVALELAAQHPGRVLGLMLADPAGDFTRVPREMMEPLLAGLDSDAYRQTIGNYWNSNLAGSRPEVEGRVLADLEATPKQTVVGVFKAQMNYDPACALRRYPGPKFSLVTPNNDMPFSLHNLGEDLPYEIFPGTGHWLHMDRPEDFNHKMDDFLVEVVSET